MYLNELSDGDQVVFYHIEEKRTTNLYFIRREYWMNFNGTMLSVVYYFSSDKNSSEELKYFGDDYNKTWYIRNIIDVDAECKGLYKKLI